MSSDAQVGDLGVSKFLWGDACLAMGRELAVSKSSLRAWDAASWHISKLLQQYVELHNEAVLTAQAIGPTVALAPLPTGAQFLNVIESVFSGMARAIIAKLPRCDRDPGP
jgi:hypothetical protein